MAWFALWNNDLALRILRWVRPVEVSDALQLAASLLSDRAAPTEIVCLFDVCYRSRRLLDRANDHF